METNTTEPEWNEQISFIEMFPPLSRKIKVQVLDDANVSDVAIATHYIDLQEISDPDRNGEARHSCPRAGCPGQPPCRALSAQHGGLLGVGSGVAEAR